MEWTCSISFGMMLRGVRRIYYYEFTGVKSLEGMLSGKNKLLRTPQRQFTQNLSVSSWDSVDTLIAASKLRTMVYDDPITNNNKGLVVYENPQKEHDYIVTVDVARGVGSDYSAFLVFDITKFPYGWHDIGTMRSRQSCSRQLLLILPKDIIEHISTKLMILEIR